MLARTMMWGAATVLAFAGCMGEPGGERDITPTPDGTTTTTMGNQTSPTTTTTPTTTPTYPEGACGDGEPSRCKGV